MPVNESKLVAPLCEYRHPPNGLTDEWDGYYRVLIDPICRVLNCSPDYARKGSRELFEAWSDSLFRSTTASRVVLRAIQGRAQRTWRAGHAILSTVAPIGAALGSAVHFLAFPQTVFRHGGTGVQPTQNGREATADSLRAGIAKKLSELNVIPLLDELAIAVKYDCDAQRGQQTGGAGRIGATTIHYLGNRAYRVGNSDAGTVTDREDTLLQAFIGNPALDSPGLAKRSGLNAEAIPSIISSLRRKYDGRFRDAIVPPGGKAKGGYKAEVIDAR